MLFNWDNGRKKLSGAKLLLKYEGFNHGQILQYLRFFFFARQKLGHVNILMLNNHWISAQIKKQINHEISRFHSPDLRTKSYFAKVLSHFWKVLLLILLVSSPFESKFTKKMQRDCYWLVNYLSLLCML